MATQQNASHVYVFMIIGKGDTPLYEVDLSTPGKREDTPHLDQFIIHTAIDMVDEVLWTTSNMFLKSVDRFNDYCVSAYVTAGHVKFLMLHKQKNEDQIRLFFLEVHELYVKTILNPFYEVNSLITSQSFDLRVRYNAKKFLV
eukprot:Trichotokara_eunicae@DN2820_c0_g1_i1.p1